MHLKLFFIVLFSFLFPVVLAEDAIKAALSDYRLKQDKNRTEDKESVQTKNWCVAQTVYSL